ncbi:MAG: IS1634 family transposase [Anaerolineae bacterium]|nr:IS1634 family transposase [Anaerolineae bacterium]
MSLSTRFWRIPISAWLWWAIICLVCVATPAVSGERGVSHLPVLTGVVTHDPQSGPLIPWQPVHRSRGWLRKEFRRRLHRAWQRVHRRAAWVKHLTRLLLRGTLSMAAVVDLLARSQLRRQMGALPVLYALLEVLQVREIINRHCPTAAEVDHGIVAVVMILNRLMTPRPLYQIADWLARTVLIYQLGVPARKFNDDRLARTLDAISQHTRDIWQDVVHRALLRADIDLSVIFYDLTAFIAHGSYADSQYVDFGFAHNTPMDKHKVKAGLNVSADGNVPTEYGLWAGRTADLATVQENMERLCRLLRSHGWSAEETLIIGDRANLNDELAIAYDDHHLRYLAGLQPQHKAHRQLLTAHPTVQFHAHPLSDERGSRGYWGIPCQVAFEHDGRRVVHQGLIVLSGPMRSARRKTRATQLRALRQALAEVQARIGRPYYRTIAAVQQRANTQLKKSPVGKLMRIEAFQDERGQIHLRYWVDRYVLWQAMQRDGRYLLVTNDGSLSPRRMLDLYRQKDGVEKRFHVSKSDLKVSPIYLHKDERIEGMLLIHMLALLAYSLLERQVRQGGLQMTTRRVIEKLETLDIVETLCWDGSLLYRLVPLDEEQAVLLEILAQVLTDLQRPRWPHPALPSGNALPLALPPITHWHAGAASQVAV